MPLFKYEFILKVKTPLHHGGEEKTGNEVLLRRIKYLVGDEIVEIPYVDGNALRGYTRRLIMKDFFDRVGWQPRSLKLYHSFMSGGVLESIEEEESSRLDLELRRMVRRYIPPLSLYGASILNQAFAGKLIVGKALPICRELNEYLPVKGDRSFYEYLDFTFATRRAEEEARAARGEGEHAVQMIYKYEVFIPGTRLYTWFTVVDPTDVELSCFGRVMELFMERPFIGGRSACGCGEVEAQLLSKTPLPSSRIYLKFLEENRDEIIRVLERLDEMVG